MSPNSKEPATLEVVVERLGHISKAVDDLRGEVKDQSRGFVSRSEFEAWQTGYDREMRDLKSQVAKIEVDASAAVAAAENRATAAVAAAENRATVAESRRPSGVAIAMGVIAFSSLALSVVVLLIQK